MECRQPVGLRNMCLGARCEIIAVETPPMKPLFRMVKLAKLSSLSSLSSSPFPPFPFLRLTLQPRESAYDLLRHASCSTLRVTAGRLTKYTTITTIYLWTRNFKCFYLHLRGPRFRKLNDINHYSQYRFEISPAQLLRVAGM